MVRRREKVEMEETTMTVLLGEAPKVSSGYAFDPGSFTTRQIAAAVGVGPKYLYNRFWLMNVFNEPQEPRGRGFDEFPRELAVNRLREMWIPNRRIVCVGKRVAEALAEMLEIGGAIPQNEFKMFRPRARKAEWQLGYIIHPSSIRPHQVDSDELVLSQATQDFLRLAASLR